MTYDAIIIGSGPGGYSCALRIAELGGKAIVIERDEVGGTCTNTGCIPTKTLFAGAQIIEKIKKARNYGIVAEINSDFATAMKNANKTASMLSKGVEYLLKKADIEIVKGEAEIVDTGKVKVRERILEARNIVVATGSKPKEIENIKFDSNKILSSEDIWKMEQIPESITIIGGGPEGVEFANIFNAYGAKVTLLEMEDRVLPNTDKEISDTLEKIMKRKGITVITGEKKEIETEKVLVVVGRVAKNNTKLPTENGWIKVDEHCRVDKGIYAIGDVIGGGLAHVAMEQGKITAENIMGKNSRYDGNCIPSCIYTDPEVAFIGKMEGKEGKAFFAANGKAVTIGEREGFVKVFVENDILIGACIVGPGATELITEATIGIKNKITVTDMRNTMHAHPTLSECFLEALKNAGT